MLGEREGSPFRFGESRRSDGRAASADRNDEGTLSFSMSGSSPQGDKESLYACKILIAKLNSLGSRWGEPSEGKDAWVDCEAVDTDDPSTILQVQIVQANVSEDLWETLNSQGAIQGASEASALAAHLQGAIRKKETRAQSGLTLALNATLLPAYAFDSVIEEFHRRYGSWAGSLGFDDIWLVGPLTDLVKRLDQTR